VNANQSQQKALHWLDVTITLLLLTTTIMMISDALTPIQSAHTQAVYDNIIT